MLEALRNSQPMIVEELFFQIFTEELHSSRLVRARSTLDGPWREIALLSNPNNTRYAR
jgi:hypothetical protein